MPCNFRFKVMRLIQKQQEKIKIQKVQKSEEKTTKNKRKKMQNYKKKIAEHQRRLLASCTRTNQENSWQNVVLLCCIQGLWLARITFAHCSWLLRTSTVAGIAYAKVQLASN